MDLPVFCQHPSPVWTEERCWSVSVLMVFRSINHNHLSVLHSCQLFVWKNLFIIVWKEEWLITCYQSCVLLIFAVIWMANRPSINVPSVFRHRLSILLTVPSPTSALDVRAGAETNPWYCPSRLTWGMLDGSSQSVNTGLCFISESLIIVMLAP